jgi:prepilin-type N-terminal cleavage/methylation domain-containing protein
VSGASGKGHRVRSMCSLNGNSYTARSHGFTLVELIVVMLLLSLVALLTFRGPVRSSAPLVSEETLLRSQLRYAQSLALADNTVSWGISISSGGYTLWKDTGPALRALPGQNSAAYTFSSKVYVTDGIGVVWFDEFGSPEDGAVMSITLSDGVHTRTITLSAETGHQS